SVLAQLGNRIQHALRAYTPREQKAVRTAAETFRQNPEIDTETAITELGVGEALVSTLEEKGVPSIVQRTLIRPPFSRLGPALPEERQKIMSNSPVGGVYDEGIDRESAFEMLEKRAAERAAAAEEAARKAAEEKAAEEKAADAEEEGGFLDSIFGGSSSKKRSRRSDSVTEAVTKSIVRSVGSTVGRQIGRAIVRGVLGSLTGR
ncbi:MAG: DUF853 family protein, partial [Hyphomicrobiales bacterium]|nr:DUF853 family protein [Hyphomicrobiales bacterium]